MYFTDDSLLPENQEPLIVKAARWRPRWLPSDGTITSVEIGRPASGAASQRGAHGVTRTDRTRTGRAARRRRRRR
jgi:hypothetical protein